MWWWVFGSPFLRLVVVGASLAFGLLGGGGGHLLGCVSVPWCSAWPDFGGCWILVGFSCWRLDGGGCLVALFFWGGICAVGRGRGGGGGGLRLHALKLSLGCLWGLLAVVGGVWLGCFGNGLGCCAPFLGRLWGVLPLVAAGPGPKRGK